MVTCVKRGEYNFMVEGIVPTATETLCYVIDAVTIDSYVAFGNYLEPSQNVALIHTQHYNHFCSCHHKMCIRDRCVPMPTTARVARRLVIMTRWRKWHSGIKTCR